MHTFNAPEIENEEDVGVLAVTLIANGNVFMVLQLPGIVILAVNLKEPFVIFCTVVEAPVLELNVAMAGFETDHETVEPTGKLAMLYAFVQYKIIFPVIDGGVRGEIITGEQYISK